MKQLLFLCMLALCPAVLLRAQVITKFTWEGTVPTAAAAGISADAVGTGVTIGLGGSGSLQGLQANGTNNNINLTFSNAASIAQFDAMPGIDVSIDFKRLEAMASLFTRGTGFDFGENANGLYVNFFYSNGAGGGIAVSSGNVYTLTNDGFFHNYRFIYDNILGKAAIFVDGVSKWSFTGVANRTIYWNGGGNVVVGMNMDGSGNHIPIIDNLLIQYPGTTLPLTLLSFSGLVERSQVNLKWSTDQEVNTDHFDVERSADAQHFQSIGEVAAAGNHVQVVNYGFTDGDPLPNDGYYRLKMVDADAKFTYSPVIHVNNTVTGSTTIYPNPAVDYVWLQAENTTAQHYQLSFFDMGGRQLSTRSLPLSANAGKQRISLPGGNDHQPLFLQLVDANGKKEVFRILRK